MKHPGNVAEEGNVRDIIEVSWEKMWINLLDSIRISGIWGFFMSFHNFPAMFDYNRKVWRMDRNP